MSVVTPAELLEIHQVISKDARHKVSAVLKKMHSGTLMILLLAPDLSLRGFHSRCLGLPSHLCRLHRMSGLDIALNRPSLVCGALLAVTWPTLYVPYIILSLGHVCLLR